LAAKSAVNISSTIIDPAALETPRHCLPPHSIRGVFASSGCGGVKAERANE
jgi:hypothetical protein